MSAPRASTPRPGSTEFVHRIWPADPHQLAGIRAAVRRWIAPLELPDEADDDIVLAVNEAVSNCIEHAYAKPSGHDTVELTFWTEPRRISFEVLDHGRWRAPDVEPTGRGRGIAVMRLLMASVLIHYDSRGTRVLLSRPLDRPRPSGVPILPGHEHVTSE